jgi:hypothetical protein
METDTDMDETAAAITTVGSDQTLTSADYYFDSYSHFGILHFTSLHYFYSFFLLLRSFSNIPLLFQEFTKSAALNPPFHFSFFIFHFSFFIFHFSFFIFHFPFSIFHFHY